MLSYLPSSLRYPYKLDVSSGFKVYDGSSVLAIKQILLNYTWSPIVWNTGYRLGENFICAHYLGLDFENPDVSMDSIINTYCDSWHIIGTTKSHQKRKKDKPPMDRFRVLLRFERPITDLNEYKHNVTYHIKHHGADESGNDGARMFHKCTDIVSAMCGDDLYDEPVREAPLQQEIDQAIEKRIAKAEFHNSYGRMSTFSRRWLLNVIPEGKRSVTVFLLGKELCRAGLECEESINRILRSPTYAGREIAPEVLRKIREQVIAGYKAVEKELRP